MSEIKRIEELDEATVIGDSDLLMASVRNNAATYGYLSKKMTMKTLADYVIESGGLSSGIQCELFDTSEEYKVYDTAEKVNDYQQDPGSNLLRSLLVGLHEQAIVSKLTKTVTKDCVVVLSMSNRQPGSGTDRFQVKINGVQVNTWFFNGDLGASKFYLKAGQTLDISDFRVQTYSTYVSIFPLVSGGRFFLDTTEEKQSIYEEAMNVTQMGNNYRRWSYTAPNYPVLVGFSGFQYNPIHTSSGNAEMYINGDPVSPIESQSSGALVLLQANDTLWVDNPSGGYYCVYPIQVGKQSSKSSNEYEIYQLSRSDDGPVEDYESDSQRNYICGLKVGVSNDANLDTLTKTYSKNCEVLLTRGEVPWTDDFGSKEVKINKVRIPTGLLSMGVGNLAQFYVKAGQTLSIESTNGYADVYVRPLKSGGNFFIDGSSELREPFTNLKGITPDPSAGNTFTFTAPKQTLFAYCSSALGGIAGLSSVTLNGKEIHWKLTWSDGSTYYYDKLILDTGDTLKLTFSGTWVYYCALPLLAAN